MKTKKELNALKEEAKSVNEEMRELTDEELAQGVGGGPGLGPKPGKVVSGVELGHEPGFVVSGFESEHIQVYFDKLIE